MRTKLIIVAMMIVVVFSAGCSREAAVAEGLIQKAPETTGVPTNSDLFDIEEADSNVSNPDEATSDTNNLDTVDIVKDGNGSSSSDGSGSSGGSTGSVGTDTDVIDPVNGIAVGEPYPGSMPAYDPKNGAADPSAKISADASKLKEIADITSIELFDLEGNKVEREFAKEELVEIMAAYNESVIQDTAYIEMIGGYTMVITLAEGTSIRITSYGAEDFVVANSSSGQSYHLYCPAIGKILLDVK